MFDLFRTAGANRLVTVDLHAAQEQGFFDGPVDHLTAMPVLIDYVRSHVPMDKATIVSPDAGRIKVSEQWAAKLGGSRSRSSTRLATSHARTMPKRMASSATCRGATAWWWTT